MAPDAWGSHLGYQEVVGEGHDPGFRGVRECEVSVGCHFVFGLVVLVVVGLRGLMLLVLELMFSRIRRSTRSFNPPFTVDPFLKTSSHIFLCRRNALPTSQPTPLSHENGRPKRAKAFRVLPRFIPKVIPRILFSTPLARHTQKVLHSQPVSVQSIFLTHDERSKPSKPSALRRSKSSASKSIC